MNTEIRDITGAVIVQSVIRYAALFGLAWLALSYVDGWITAWLATSGAQ